MSGRWGINVPLPGLPLADHRDALRRLVDLGYTDAWTQETAGFDAFTPLALTAALAPELRLGTAIASVFARGPALLAQSGAALADAAPGRFVLGIGSSSRAMVTGWNGIPFRDPYGRVRDTLRFLRRALSGERVQERYPSFTVSGFTLDRPPAVPPPIYLAALRPAMLRLAAREADGVMLSLVGPEDVPRIRAALEEASGRPAPELVLRIGVWPDADAARARAWIRRQLAVYLSVPAYAGMHEWLGRGEALAPVRSAWQAGDRRAAAEAVPDAWVDTLLVHGAPGACRERLEAFREAGIDTPIVSVLPGVVDPSRLPVVLRELVPR